METVTLETIHGDLSRLINEVAELRTAILAEPELDEGVRARVEEARERMKRRSVPHDEMMEEFA